MAREDPVTLALPPENGAGVALPDDLACVFIVFTHRNGSFYLANLLATSEYFNEAQEDFSQGAILGGCEQHGYSSLAQYFSAVAQQRARNGHFVAKLTIGELNLL